MLNFYIIKVMLKNGGAVIVPCLPNLVRQSKPKHLDANKMLVLGAIVLC